jgi:hypothetical protein
MVPLTSIVNIINKFIMTKVKEKIQNSETKILKTEDYSLFELTDINRDPKHSENVKASIEIKNLTSYIPILVKINPNNGKYTIYDGQGRFIACTNLGLSIYFVIGENLEIDDIQLLNISQEKWKPEDYLRHYANRGFEEYKKIEELLGECKHMKIGYILQIWQFRIKDEEKEWSSSATLRRGKYILPDHAADRIREIDRVLRVIHDKVEPERITNVGAIARAIGSLYLLDVDLYALTDQITKHPHQFRPQANQALYKVHFEEVYNFRRGNKNRISLAKLEVMKSLKEKGLLKEDADL